MNTIQIIVDNEEGIDIGAILEVQSYNNYDNSYASKDEFDYMLCKEKTTNKTWHIASDCFEYLDNE